MEPEWTRQELEALRVVRGFLTTSWRSEDGDISEVRVWLEGEPGTAELAVTFKHRDRPGCVFGSRHFAVAELGTPVDPTPSPTDVWVHLDEQIEAVGYGLPADCRPGEVTWF